MLFQRYGETGLYTRRPLQTAHWVGREEDGQEGQQQGPERVEQGEEERA